MKALRMPDREELHKASVEGEEAVVALIGRLCRRLARVEHQFLTLFNLLGKVAKEQNADNIYIADSLLVAVCDNDRSGAARPDETRLTAAVRPANGATSIASKFIRWSPMLGNQSNSSCRPAPSAIPPPSTSLTSTSHRKRGSSVTRPATSTSSKRSGRIVACFSCRCAKTTQNAHTRGDCATCWPPPGNQRKPQAVRSNDSCPNIFTPLQQMASNSRPCSSFWLPPFLPCSASR